MCEKIDHVVHGCVQFKGIFSQAYEDDTTWHHGYFFDWKKGWWFMGNVLLIDTQKGKSEQPCVPRCHGQ
jgi:hypothetical protein